MNTVMTIKHKSGRQKTAFVNDRVYLLRVDDIIPNRQQPRRKFDERQMNMLIDSIREYGIIQPLIVRENELCPGLYLNGVGVRGEKYEIIAGERRWRAACRLNYKTVPCVIIEADNPTALAIAALENLQRSDLSFFEQGCVIHSLVNSESFNDIELYRITGLTQNSFQSRSRLLNLNPDEAEYMLENDLTLEHAMALSRINLLSERRRLTDKVIKDGSTAAECEALVNDYMKSLFETDKPLKEKQNTNENRKGKRVVILGDIRLFLNTVTRAISTIGEAGLEIERTDEDKGDHIEMLLKIPKGTGVKARKTDCISCDNICEPAKT